MLNQFGRKKITIEVRRKPVVLTGAALEIKQKLTTSLEQCRKERAAFAATQPRPEGTSDADWERYLSGELFDCPYPKVSIYQTTPAD
jgi:hypothetical protein